MASSEKMRGSDRSVSLNHLGRIYYGLIVAALIVDFCLILIVDCNAICHGLVADYIVFFTL